MSFVTTYKALLIYLLTLLYYSSFSTFHRRWHSLRAGSDLACYHMSALSCQLRSPAAACGLMSLPTPATHTLGVSAAGSWEYLILLPGHAGTVGTSHCTFLGFLSLLVSVLWVHLEIRLSRANPVGTWETQEEPWLFSRRLNSNINLERHPCFENSTTVLNSRVSAVKSDVTRTSLLFWAS